MPAKKGKKKTTRVQAQVEEREPEAIVEAESERERPGGINAMLLQTEF